MNPLLLMFTLLRLYNLSFWTQDMEFFRVLHFLSFFPFCFSKPSQHLRPLLILSAAFEALSAATEAFSATSETLLAASEALSAASEALQCA